MKNYVAQQEAIMEAIDMFPAEFGLAAFSGKRFRISHGSSYYSEVEGVMLYLQIQKPDGWVDFCKGTVSELRAEMVKF